SAGRDRAWARLVAGSKQAATSDIRGLYSDASSKLTPALLKARSPTFSDISYAQDHPELNRPCGVLWWHFASAGQVLAGLPFKSPPSAERRDGARSSDALVNSHCTGGRGAFCDSRRIGVSGPARHRREAR